MFAPGDEVVCVDAEWHGTGSFRDASCLVQGRVYVVSGIAANGGVHLSEIDAENPLGFKPSRFRKVQRRKTDLSIEAFLTIKPGFEEPKRAPAKRRERA